VADLLGDLIGGLLGGLLGDLLHQRRAQRKSVARLGEFKDGKEVTIRCALRYPDSDHPRWSHGKLTLSRGKASWKRRFAKDPTLTLNRHTAIGVRTRRISTREAWRVSSKSIVLLYVVEGVSVEIAVRWYTVALLGKVLDIPPG
jgi:hypothetical protein